MSSKTGFAGPATPFTICARFATRSARRPSAPETFGHSAWMASRCADRPLLALTQPAAATAASTSTAIAISARVKVRLLTFHPGDHRADAFEIRTKQRHRVRLPRLDAALAHIEQLFEWSGVDLKMLAR